MKTIAALAFIALLYFLSVRISPLIASVTVFLLIPLYIGYKRYRRSQQELAELARKRAEERAAKATITIDHEPKP